MQKSTEPCLIKVQKSPKPCLGNVLVHEKRTTEMQKSTEPCLIKVQKSPKPCLGGTVLHDTDCNYVDDHAADVEDVGYPIRTGSFGDRESTWVQEYTRGNIP